MVVAFAAVVLVGPALGIVVAHPVQGARESTGVTSASATLTSVTVTWDGQDVSSASQPSSAFSLDKGATAVVYYSFDELLGAPITNASLQLTYLGIVLTTSKAATSPATQKCFGCADAGINWSFGQLTSALEGVFQMTASLLYANGTVAWSESFYVFAKAPYLLESGAVIVLLILVVAELYWGTQSIREARRGARPPKPPEQPTATEPTQGPGTPPATGDQSPGMPTGPGDATSAGSGPAGPGGGGG